MSKLIAGDDAPLKNKEDRTNLAIFMGQQYTRTKKIRDSFIPPSEEQVLEKYKEFDLQKIHEILSFIYANHIGALIFERLELRLIENTSSINLITSDQPIYNLLATPNLPTKDVKIYYPISPRFALIAEETTNHRKYRLDENAAELNSFTAKNAHQLIFSSSEEDLIQTGKGCAS